MLHDEHAVGRDSWGVQARLSFGDALFMTP
jgi:hypothetical protein